MQHEPRGFLGNSQTAMQLPRANPVLAVADHPDRNHPLVESKSGVLEDRSHLERELLLTDVAEPQLARLDKRVLGIAATRTSDVSTGPAPANRVLKSAFFVGKVGDCFLESFGVLHVRNSILDAHVCQG